MKKAFLYIITLLGLALAAVYIFIPRTLKISQSIRVAANKEGLYRKLSNPAAWVQWWPGNKNPDTSGAWEMDGTLFSPLPPKMLSVPISMNKGELEAEAELTFIAINTDSCVLHAETSIDASDNPFKRVSTYFTAVKIKEQLTRILQAADQSYRTVSNLYDYPIEKKLVVDSNLVFISAELKSVPGLEQVYAMVTKLNNYIKSSNATATGHPMLNVFTRDSSHYLVKVAIPVDRRLPDAGEIHYKWMLGGGNILITEVKGGPGEIKKAYGQITNYVNDYKRIAPAIPFESMVTDRLQVKDTSQWITRIYYPVI